MIKQYKYNTDYFISDTGDIFRVIKLVPHKNRNGYLRVRIQGKIKKKRINKMVHKLVAETFIKEIDNNLQVNHKDKNRTNCKIENLEIVTAIENYFHRDNFIPESF